MDSLPGLLTRVIAEVTIMSGTLSTTANPSSRLSKTDLRNLLLCCLGLLALVAISRPFADSGFDDDWSFSHLALRLSQTGHFQYNGWGSPPAVFQSCWAAMWIRLFGFSFDLLRVVTIPISLGFVSLTYLLAREVGLSEKLALFAALTVGSCPLFLPLAPSFMTDPYASSFSLLCLYAAVRCLNAASSVSARNWLWILVLSGILGGSDRQTVWVAPLLLVPYLFWRKRSDRGFRRQAVIAYTVCLLALVALVHYFNQPYQPTEVPREELFRILLSEAPKAAGRLASVLLVGVMLSLPAFLCAQTAWKRLAWREIGIIATACAIAVRLLASSQKSGIVPFLGNILTTSGILFPGIEGMGLKPVFITRPVQFGLTFVVLLVFAVWCYLMWRKGIRITLPSGPRGAFAAFFFGYWPLMIPGAFVGLIFDRYVLPLLPVMVIVVLSSVQPFAKKVPALAWGCMLVLASFGAITTHDYFATLRARAEAARELSARGVPQNRFSIGLERDGWTQLQLTGKIKPLLYGDQVKAAQQRYWFWLYTGAIHPDYEAVAARRGAALSDVLLRIPYRTWLPPFQRDICVLKVEVTPKQGLARDRQ